MERKQKAQEAYAKWKKESKKKPVPVPSGYAYSQGMLKGIKGLQKLSST